MTHILQTHMLEVPSLTVMRTIKKLRATKLRDAGLLRAIWSRDAGFSSQISAALALAKFLDINCKSLENLSIIDGNLDGTNLQKVNNNFLENTMNYLTNTSKTIF